MESATQQFNAAVLTEMRRGKTRMQAVAIVARANPDLHESYRLENNPNPAAKRAIRAHFEAYAK
jgi:hypothetical protein